MPNSVTSIVVLAAIYLAASCVLSKTATSFGMIMTLFDISTRTTLGFHSHVKYW
jgi:hypothetical protein